VQYFGSQNNGSRVVRRNDFLHAKRVGGNMIRFRRKILHVPIVVFATKFAVDFGAGMWECPAAEYRGELVGRINAQVLLCAAVAEDRLEREQIITGSQPAG